jgi:phosphonate transport system permease protein
VHRYFFGWENFWADFGSPVWGLSWGERLALIVSGDRIDPARSNLRLIWDEFLGNSEWQHARVFVSLFETLLMAVLGTLIAAIAALPLAFLAARNFTPGMAARFATRRLMDFVRAVDSLIWSLIFIRSFGLGPLTGSLAIGVTDAGSLGKLFSEALENIDQKQVEGVQSVGASRAQTWRFGVIPQILPVLVSQSLYYLESNTRSATVIGALGAGGIGLMLVETMRTSRDWENVAYIIALIIALVIAMDTLSSWLRRRLIEGKAV